MEKILFLNEFLKDFGINGIDDYDTKISSTQFKKQHQFLRAINKHIPKMCKLFIMAPFNLSRKKYKIDTPNLAVSVLKKALQQANIPFEIIRSSKITYVRLIPVNYKLVDYIAQKNMDYIQHANKSTDIPNLRDIIPADIPVIRVSDCNLSFIQENWSILAKISSESNVVMKKNPLLRGFFETNMANTHTAAIQALVDPINLDKYGEHMMVVQNYRCVKSFQDLTFRKEDGNIILKIDLARNGDLLGQLQFVIMDCDGCIVKNLIDKVKLYSGGNYIGIYDFSIENPFPNVAHIGNLTIEIVLKTDKISNYYLVTDCDHIYLTSTYRQQLTKGYLDFSKYKIRMAHLLPNNP